MKYPKTALSFPDQADRLLARGLVADRSQLIECLRSVNYYRLSAYWYTFRIDGDSNDKLIPGTTLATVWSRYVFDRQLRLFAQYPNVPLRFMGFPSDWMDCPIWIQD